MQAQQHGTSPDSQPSHAALQGPSVLDLCVQMGLLDSDTRLQSSAGSSRGSTSCSRQGGANVADCLLRGWPDSQTAAGQRVSCSGSISELFGSACWIPHTAEGADDAAYSNARFTPGDSPYGMYGSQYGLPAELYGRSCPLVIAAAMHADPALLHDPARMRPCSTGPACARPCSARPACARREALPPHPPPPPPMPPRNNPCWPGAYPHSWSGVMQEDSSPLFTMQAIG